MSKQTCGDYHCGWHGDSDDVLKAPHPFEAGTVLSFCPECKGVGTYLACDEPNCWEISTAGTPTKLGYRRTCGKHIPHD